MGWKIARKPQPRSGERTKDRASREFDFHGLRVNEALDRLEEIIDTTCDQGIRDVTVISGRGIHSEGGVPKIKPAFEKYFRDNHIRYQPINRGGAFKLQLNC
jgi:DNA-nicking Smr family endonuclease